MDLTEAHLPFPKLQSLRGEYHPPPSLPTAAGSRPLKAFLPPELPQEHPDQRLAYPDATGGPVAILLRLGVFTGTTLLSDTWAVIQEGRTLVLFLDFKVSISVVSPNKESGPELSDLLDSGQQILLLSHQELEASFFPKGTNL